mmetsp:Transcript_12436/g.28229  ORF Transcript_12436/g.28229 Transcript_12436/m.28229 type:complete len:298 (+) Transcript_12436:200-1093(+)
MLRTLRQVHRNASQIQARTSRPIVHDVQRRRVVRKPLTCHGNTPTILVAQSHTLLVSMREHVGTQSSSRQDVTPNLVRGDVVDRRKAVRTENNLHANAQQGSAEWQDAQDDVRPGVVREYNRAAPRGWTTSARAHPSTLAVPSSHECGRVVHGVRLAQILLRSLVDVQDAPILVQLHACFRTPVEHVARQQALQQKVRQHFLAATSRLLELIQQAREHGHRRVILPRLGNLVSVREVKLSKALLAKFQDRAETWPAVAAWVRTNHLEVCGKCRAERLAAPSRLRRLTCGCARALRQA